MTDFRTRAWRDEDYDVVASWWDTDHSLRSILGADPARHLDEVMPERLVVTNGASDTPVAVAGMRRLTPTTAFGNIILSPDHRKGFNAMRVAKLAEEAAADLGITHLFQMPSINNEHARAVCRWMKYQPIPVILMVKELR